MNRYEMFAALCTAFCLASVGWGQPADTPGALKIGSTALGNVFYEGQPVTLSLDINADALEYSVQDAWGVQVFKNTQAIMSHPMTLSLELKRLGYYEVTISAKRGQQIIEQGTARLAVLSRFDLSAVKESPFGVMTHFAQGWEPDIVPLIAAAGIKHVRDEAYWAAVERSRGQFDFSQFDRYMAALADNHIASLTPLTWGNPLYDRSDEGPDWCIAPYSKEGFEAYARYCQKAVAHFDPQTQAVEIWNEYNGAFAPGPADGKPEVYAEMIKHAYPAIKQARPNITVLGCSTAGLSLDWIENVFKHGGLDAMDGVSIHPYSYGSAPEWLDKDIPLLQELIRRYNHGKDKSIWATEDGWFTIPPSASSRSNPLSEMTKARYLVRAYTLLQSLGVEKTFWYLFRDYDQFGTMGLVGRPDDPAGRYAPHQAYVAYAVMARQLTGARFVGRDATDPAIRSYQFDRAGRTVRVMWSSQPQNVVVDGSFYVTDMMGQEYSVESVGRGVHLTLSESPIYVDGLVQSITLDKSFAMQVAAEAAVGEPLSMHLAFPVGLADQHLRIQVDGAQRKLDAPNGQADIELAPSQAIGERWTPFKFRVNDRLLFAGSALTQMRAPVVFDQFPHLVGLNSLEVRIYNMSQRNTLKLRSLKWTLNNANHEQPMAKDIAPGQSETVSLACDGLKPWTIYPATIAAEFDNAAALQWAGEVSDNPVPKRTMKVDGDLAAWQDLPSIDLSQAPFVKLLAKNQGEGDLSGQVWLCWDEQNLYFAASIRKAVFFQQDTGYNVWKGDNIQLGFNSGMPWPGGQAGSGHQELGLTLTPLGPQFYRFSGDGKKIGVIGEVPLAIKRDGESTNYQCAIPWSQLDAGTPERGGFSFGIYVNENDGKGRKGYHRWADIKAPAAHQPCYLQE